jgi:hypothetical protein
MLRTSIKLTPEKVGKALKYLDYERVSRKLYKKVKHGYWIKEINPDQQKTK